MSQPFVCFTETDCWSGSIQSLLCTFLSENSLHQRTVYGIVICNKKRNIDCIVHTAMQRALNNLHKIGFKLKFIHCQVQCDWHLNIDYHVLSPFEVHCTEYLICITSSASQYWGHNRWTSPANLPSINHSDWQALKLSGNQGWNMNYINYVREMKESVCERVCCTMMLVCTERTTSWQQPRWITEDQKTKGGNRCIVFLLIMYTSFYKPHICQGTDLGVLRIFIKGALMLV